MVHSSQKPTRLLALMNQKGGVGKTTTTVNLAAAFAEAGRPTLVVDLDPQAHATLHLGVDPGGHEGPTVYDLILPDEAPTQAHAETPTEATAPPPIATPVKARDNLDLIPAETDLAAAESELAAVPNPLGRLRDALTPLLPNYDTVLIDCPPSLGRLTLNGLVAAREVLIPMQAHFLALQGMSKLLETVQMVRGNAMQRGPNPRLRVAGVVLCMHDNQSTHAQEVVGELKGFFEAARSRPDAPWRYARVYTPHIRRNIKLAECPSFGQTIFDYAADANGAADYRALAARMLEEWDGMIAKIASGDAPTSAGPTAGPHTSESNAAEATHNTTTHNTTTHEGQHDDASGESDGEGPIKVMPTSDISASYQAGEHDSGERDAPPGASHRDAG